jgi:hypothetical protein
MFSDEVKEKIEILKRLDKDFKLFGADYHRYELNPPLTQKDVSSFEERNQISLPIDYRDFVLTLGNGGAGPYYGIYPLRLDYNIDHRMEGDVQIDLSAPFPHSKAWNQDWIDRIDWDGGESPDDDLMDGYFYTSHISGALCICHYGCGDFLLLVVNGREKGDIWGDGRGNYRGIYPEETKDGEGVTFSTWYLNWLDACLEELAGNRKV